MLAVDQDRRIVALEDPAVGELDLLRADRSASSEDVVDPAEEALGVGREQLRLLRGGEAVPADELRGGRGDREDVAEGLIRQRDAAMLVLEQDADVQTVDEGG